MPGALKNDWSQYGNRKTEKRPAWTMDVMILDGLNEISKSIDDAAMSVDAGDMSRMIDWRAGLKQFYRNIKSFFSEDLISITENSFVEVDRLLNMTDRSMPASEEGIKKAYMLLSNMNEMFYHARNDVFMKFIEIVDQRTKTTNYSFGALPQEERDKMMGGVKNE